MFRKTVIFALLCFSIASINAAEDNGLFGIFGGDNKENPLADMFKKIIDIPINGVKAAVNVTKDVFENGKGVVGDAGQALNEAINEKLQFGARSFGRIGKVLSNTGNNAREALQGDDLGQVFGKLFSAGFNVTKDIASNTMDEVKDGFSTVKKVIDHKVKFGGKAMNRTGHVFSNGIHQVMNVFADSTTKDPELA